MLCAAYVQDYDSLGDEPGGERDILGNDQVAGLRVLDNVVVGDIGSTLDQNR